MLIKLKLYVLFCYKFQKRSLRKVSVFGNILVRIFRGFSTFELNTERYISLRIQFECGKMLEKCGQE